MMFPERAEVSGSGSEERGQRLLAPIAVPVAVEAQGAQAHQGDAGLVAPMHALVLLTAGHEQVVGLLGLAAADGLTLLVALPIAGDRGAAGLQGERRPLPGSRGIWISSCFRISHFMAFLSVPIKSV